MNQYKITTPKNVFTFEGENMTVISVHNKQLKEWEGKPMFDLILYCERKGYTFEKTGTTI